MLVFGQMLIGRFLYSSDTIYYVIAKYDYMFSKYHINVSDNICKYIGKNRLLVYVLGNNL